ncbi:MAG TPA: WD40 repeat domain-containing protein, partial [Intrasporangium sp.]|nr:WD40 repeat domain-containing protein [Intrasporangium sp.]
DIRDAASGVSVMAFQGHDDDVNDVAFSEDGSMLATTGDDGALRVWATATGEELLEVQSPAGPDVQDVPVRSPSFSADGTLVVAAWPEAVRVIDVGTGRTATRIPAEDPFSAAISPNGTRVAIGGDEVTATVVDAVTGKRLLTLTPRDGDKPLDIAWSPDGRSFATAQSDGTARVWDGSTGDAVVSVPAHTGLIWELDWSPDGSRLATAGDDGTARVSEITEDGFRTEFTFSAQETSRGGGVGGVSFSPDGQRLLAGDSAITSSMIWDASATGGGELANVRDGGVEFTPDGRGLLAFSDEHGVYIADTETGERLSQIRPPPVPQVYWAEMSDDGRLLATLGPRGITVRDAATWAPHFTIPWDEFGLVQDMAWSSNGDLLAVAISPDDGPGQVRVMDESGAEVARLEEEPGQYIRTLSFNRDGTLLAMTRSGITTIDPTRMPVTIWDWKRDEVVRRIDASAELVTFDPQGALIASSRRVEGVADVWDARSGQRVATLTASAHVLDLAFNATGTRLATTHSDGTIRLWDPRTGAQTLVLYSADEEVDSVGFSPDGSMLASSGASGIVHVWTLDLDVLMDIAKARLKRGFSEEECRVYLHLTRCASA